jgi:hypothetical protein
VSASTTSAPLAKAVRLISANLYWQFASSSAQPASGTPQLIWVSEDYLKPESKSTEVLGAAKIGHVVLVPPKNTLAGFWHNEDSTEDLFRITVANGGTPTWSAVLDIDVEMVLSDANHSTTFFVGASGTSTSIGQFAPPNMVPVGFQGI